MGGKHHGIRYKLDEQSDILCYSIFDDENEKEDQEIREYLFRKKVQRT